MKADWIVSGQRVLEEESKALLTGASRLDKNFSMAARTLFECSGKTILTGLGKSGHIARKIAATLSSTGTPAIFLDPSEASHGDLGVIGENDCLVALAYGGETSEVLTVARFFRNLNLPVIAISGKSQSTLAQLSDYFIDAYVAQEADGLGLAPTSSSTLTLALGDALAVTLMEMRNFGREDFAKFHPGGRLGRSLSSVEALMVPKAEMTLLLLDAPFDEIVAQMAKPNHGVAAVVTNEQFLRGVVTDGDLRRALEKFGKDVFDMNAADIMGNNPKSVPASMLAVDALEIMERGGISALFVRESAEVDSNLIGLLRFQSLIGVEKLNSMLRS